LLEHFEQVEKLYSMLITYDAIVPNVIWNNAFRKNFQCCWCEIVSCLFYYCKTLIHRFWSDL